MVIFFSIYFLVIIVDLINLCKRKIKKEIILYLILTLITVIVALFYYKDYLRPSLVKILMDYLKI